MSNVELENPENAPTGQVEIPENEPVIPRSRSLFSRLEYDESHLSTTDICRICHMGGFPAVTVQRPMWEWPKQTSPSTVRQVDSQISTLSSYAYLGPLISACKCRGTVGLVHAECLERWLTESGHSCCELCGYKYLTKRVPRHGMLQSVWIWFNTVIATRQMILDVLYLIVTTPLALFSIYICALALKMILNSGFYEVPWMIVAMLPTCSLTLVAYWSWIITLGRYISRLHGRRWRRFWRTNFVVRLLPNDPSSPDNDNEQAVADARRQEEQRIIEEQEDLEDLLQLAF
ncbi:E3 ubiquitin-protein ligase MARCHF3-like isoform X1 [Microplitis mediator]|uniref:E3 ubiquitin-protein ligase MARCHF3-like isoform X1 n=1 Tax=Microplitis mediator TaxID=375433 RepID=UPI002553D6C6|nr:E3 ubiquitin-protein ligase MARCHF3-like isoform X1 [Microplitis mediator]